MHVKVSVTIDKLANESILHLSMVDKASSDDVILDVYDTINDKTVIKYV